MTVLGDDHALVAPVERWLAYLTSIERSPGPVKAYAHDLKDWFCYLAGHGLGLAQQRSRTSAEPVTSATASYVILYAMSGLEFVAALVSALAWPITVAGAVVFLRRPLERWMHERPSRIKAGPVEVEWDSLISKVQADLDQPGIPDPAALTSSAETQDRDLYLRARVTPPAAIVEASRRVEAELRRRLSAIGVEVSQQGPGALAQLAQRHGLINEATQKSVAGLVVLRNLAVHAPHRVSAEEALEFVALAEATEYAITAGHVKPETSGA